MIKKIHLLLLISLMITALSAERLPPALSNMIAKSGLKSSELGIYIKETKRDKTIAALNIDDPFLPASVIKVYSAYAILLELGYEYRWATNFYYTGGYNNGAIGVLIVQAQGDPTLRNSHIPSIVKALKKRGIKKIKRNIVIDREYFKVPKRDSSHFDKNIYSAYNAMPDALMFNEHVSRFSLYPKGGKYQVVKQIPGSSYKVSNNIKVVNGSCKGSRATPIITVNHTNATPILQLSGKLSKQCKKRSYRYIITKPYKEFYEALKNELRRQGISYKGKMKLGKVIRGAKKVHTHYSDTLENIISKTSKKSNNVFARHLLLTLGAKIYGAPANLNKGRRAVEKILNRYHLLHSSETCIDNGCGLSRESRITARSMAKVLDHAYKSYGNRWMQTLSIAGKDGTIRRRFAHTKVKNRAWMKTGTLNRVKNISGYLLSKSNRLYTVVILVNSKRAKWMGAKLQNDIMKWLVTYKDETPYDTQDMLPIESKPKKSLWDFGKIGLPTSTILIDARDKKEYFVQVGSFTTTPSKDFLERLTTSGFHYKIIKQQGYNKVMVGPYKDSIEATKALKVLKLLSAGAYISEL